jgi:hypothetical protein
MFHLPYSPAQSGNASGVDATSSQDISWGTWVLLGGDNTPSQSFYDIMGQNALGSGGWKLGAHSGAALDPEWAWRAEIGITNGATTTVIRNVDNLMSGVWQHVVCTVDTDATTDNVKIYVSGVLRASGDATVAPAPSGTHPSTRLFCTSSKTSEVISNACGSRGVILGETFFMRRTLTEGEVAGIFSSGFVAVPAGTGILQSDISDSLKDTIGAQAAASSILQFTAWNANNAADPTGSRHMTSGYHPAWLKVIGEGSTSGLNFGTITQHTASGIKAITFRNTTPETAINNIRFWMSDVSAFAGVTGWEVSMHVDSQWLPNLTLPSGSGVVSRTLAAASSILQSNGSATISGGTLDGNLPSGESGVSQYIYLSFVTNGDFVPNTYGPTGFNFRITADNV